MDVATHLRIAIKSVAKEVLALKTRQQSRNVPPNLGESDLGEMIANVTLAYRHLEDASMRLGKAIQAADGGKSVYDKGSTVGEFEEPTINI